MSSNKNNLKVDFHILNVIPSSVGGVAGAIGSIIALFTDGFLGACGTVMIAGSLINPFIAIGKAAVGIGLLALIGTLTVTQYLKHSSKDSIDKLEKLDSNSENY